MEEKTLYVSDLDGTLLNGQTLLSSETVLQLNHLIANEHILFTVATARTPATVTALMEPVHTTLPFIVMAGAAFWDNAIQHYQDVAVIDNEIVAQLLHVYDQYGIHPFIYRKRGNVIQAHHVAHFTEQETEFINFRLKSPLKELRSATTLNADDPDVAMLVLSMGKYDRLRKIADEVERRHIACTIMCYHDIFDGKQGYLEIYADNTTKAGAIRKLATKIGAQRVVVFGDNLNDLPMFREADYSIAVGNAFEEVKELADEVIGTNDEDAVAIWIRKDIEKRKWER